MINLICGLSGSGKTTYCVGIMKKLKKAVYVVPEPMSFVSERMITDIFGAASPAGIDVTTFRRMFFNTITAVGMGGHTKLSDGGKAIILGFLCKKLKNEFKVLGKSASYRGFSEVACELISEFKNYGITPDILKNFSSENNKLKNKLDDISLIYSEYEKIISGKYATADDELGILAGLIRENPHLFINKTFIFDGFSCFIPAELNVISALESCGSGIYITLDCNNLPFSGENDIFADQKRSIEKLGKISKLSLTYLDEIHKNDEFLHITKSLSGVFAPPVPQTRTRMAVFNNQYDEITFAAEEILRLVRDKNMRFRDISIIARDSERYNPVIKRIFSEHGIPVFISDSINATAQPAVYTVLDALEAVLKNFSYETMFAYLKSGFANLDYDELDVLENYIIATGIRGSAWINGSFWHYTPKIAGSDEDGFLEKINDIKERVAAPLITLKTSLLAGKTVKEKAEAVFKFTENINLFDRINSMITRFNGINPTTSAYYGQVWNVFITTLDEIVDILGKTEVSNDEFYDILVTGLMTHEISVIPTTGDCVNICGALDSIASDVVFVVGTNEGVYPQVMTTEGILSDSDRLYLRDGGVNLAHDTVTRAFCEDFVIYNILCRARELMYITYPISDMSGASRHPARIISKMRSLFKDGIIEDRIIPDFSDAACKITAPLPALGSLAENMRLAKEGSDIDPIWYNVENWFKNSPQWQERYKLMKSGLSFTPHSNTLRDPSLMFPETQVKLSVSRLELYRKCPFAYFARYGLKLCDRRQAQLDYMDTGTIMHDVLEKLSTRIEHSGFSWQTVSDAFLKTEIYKLTDEKIAEIEQMFDYKSQKRHFLLLRLRDTLLTSVIYIASHLKSGKFVPLGYEIEFDDNKKYTPLEFDVGGKKIKLRGKIDRADVYTDENGRKFVRVIDYKSGNKSFDIIRMYYGLDLQLAVYLDRLCDLEDAHPAGFLYFRLHDSLIPSDSGLSEEKIEKELDKSHQLSGLVIKDPDVVLAMDSTLKSLPVSFTKEGNFTVYSSVADYESFKGIRKTLHKTIRAMSRELLSGNTSITPVIPEGGSSSCEFCEYGDVCHFEEKCGGKYKRLDKIPDIWDIIKKEGESDA